MAAVVTDYERAWIELQAFVAGKTQHGREGLLTEMAEIAARCRVPAGELSRLLRLHGVEVERARSIEAESDPADGAASGEDSLLAGRAASRGIIDHSGGHDVGSSNGARRR